MGIAEDDDSVVSNSGDDSSSVSSADLTCSLTLPPVPTAREVEQFRQNNNAQLQQQQQQDDDSSSSSSSSDDDSDDSDSDEISSSLTLPPEPTAVEIAKYRSGELRHPQQKNGDNVVADSLQENSNKEQPEEQPSEADPTNQQFATAADSCTENEAAVQQTNSIDDDDENDEDEDEDSEAAADDRSSNALLLPIPPALLSSSTAAAVTSGSLASTLEKKNDAAAKKITTTATNGGGDGDGALSVVSETSTVPAGNNSNGTTTAKGTAKSSKTSSKSKKSSTKSNKSSDDDDDDQASTDASSSNQSNNRSSNKDRSRSPRKNRKSPSSATTSTTPPLSPPKSPNKKSVESGGGSNSSKSPKKVKTGKSKNGKKTNKSSAAASTTESSSKTESSAVASSTSPQTTTTQQQQTTTSTTPQQQPQNHHHHHHLPGTAACAAFMDRLVRHTDVEKFGIELPVIAVMGDTSSGKSSVLSQLVEIELPKAQNLTTRCPVRLHLAPCGDGDLQSQRQRRRAVVSVQWRSNIISNQYPDFAARTIVEDETENEAETDSNNNNNNNTSTWDQQIADAIAAAQAHILQHTRREVTHDLVAVDVESPHYSMELTVVDLPGMVRSKAGIEERSDLSASMAALQQEYLQLQRCILVAVHAANVDWHNAQITADCLRVDPDTTRTLAVLTKPDLIDRGAERDVGQLLQGRNLQFALGLHMIKSRGQAALDENVSLREALQQEADYFATQEPWKSVADRTLFGTAELRRKLGDLQMAMIRQSLPAIVRQIRDQQQQAAATLAAMGQLHNTNADRRRYYQDVCRDICSCVSVSLSGKGSRALLTSNNSGSSHGSSSRRSSSAPTPPPSAAARLHDDCSHFRDRIQEGALATIRKVVEGGTVLVSGRRGMVRGEVVHLDQTFACVDYVKEQDRHSETLFEGTGLKHGGPEPIEENDVWSDASKIYIARDKNVYDSLRKIPLNSIRTDPSWLKDKIAGNRTDDLACFLNSDTFSKIVQDLIEEDWKPHALRLLELTRETLMQALNVAVQCALDNDRYPPLRALVSQQCHAAAKELLDQAQQQVLAHLEVEKHPYTQDQALFEKIAAGRHRNLKCDLEVALKCDSEGVFDTQAIQAIMDSVFERHRLRSVEMQMAEELEIVLDAYGEVAARRVVDRTPMICWECFRSLPNAIRDALDRVTDEVLQRHMREDPAFAARYSAALEEQSEMSKALEIFESMA